MKIAMSVTEDSTIKNMIFPQKTIANPNTFLIWALFAWKIGKKSPSRYTMIAWIAMTSKIKDGDICDIYMQIDG